MTWREQYKRVRFDLDALTDPMEVIYFEPVIGWEGDIEKEFDQHIMATFHVVEPYNDKDHSYDRIYVVPKRLLKGMA